MNPGDTQITPADVTNLPAFLTECDEFAAGLQSQAVASQAGTALGGHPSPAYFNGRAASLLKAAADLVRKFAPVVNAKPAEPDVPEPASPAEPGPHPTVAPAPRPAQAEQPAKKK